MPLLDRPPHRVTVYPAIDVADPDTGIAERRPGNPMATGTELRCWIQRPSASSDTVDGYMTSVGLSLMCRAFPGRARSVVLWDGALYDVPDEPEERRATPAMKHVVVRLVARTPGV